MSRYELYEEGKLLQLVAANDCDAFAELVGRYWNNIYSQALVYLKSTHQAQDIVQDVFLKIWEKRHTLATVDRFDSFLFIVARNHIISSFRKKITQPQPGSLSEPALETGSRPDDLLWSKELQEVISSGIDLLPSQQKTAFLLSREEGLTYDAVALQMGLSKETVKKHIGRALNFLRHYIQAHTDISLPILLYFLL